MVSLSLVVPLFNEESRLAEHAVELGRFIARYGPGSELILVDDGSTDDTLGVADQLAPALGPRARVIARPHAGKGAAVQAGLEAARGSVAAFCDVDLATPLDEIERLVAIASRAPALAIGSRDVVSTRIVRPEGHVRETLGRLYNRMIRMSLTPGIFDTQCGAKAAPRAVWEEILPFCRERGFSWDVEVIAIARRRGVAVWEVGVEWHHDPRTRVRVGRDGLAMLTAVPRIAGRVRTVGSLVAGPVPRPIDLRELERELELIPSA